MTSGERAVWAAEFVRRMGLRCPAAGAAYWAARAVDAMREPVPEESLGRDARAMLADMLSTEAGR